MASFIFDKYFIPIIIIWMILLLTPVAIPRAGAQQTGSCTGGSQYCEQNTLETTSESTATNTNHSDSAGSRGPEALSSVVRRYR